MSTFALLMMALARELEDSWLTTAAAEGSTNAAHQEPPEPGLLVRLDEEGALFFEGASLAPPEPDVVTRLGSSTARAISRIEAEAVRLRDELRSAYEHNVREPLVELHEHLVHRRFTRRLKPLG